MNIQVIQYKPTMKTSSGNVVISNINKPRSLDEFDINVIDLSSPDIWYNNAASRTDLLVANDLRSVRAMIDRVSSSTTLFVLPANVLYHYHYGYMSGKGNTFHYSAQLKDMIPELCAGILHRLILPFVADNSLVFEATETIINDVVYSSDFFLDNYAEKTIRTNSIKSNKPTTVYIEGQNCYITTLNITENVDYLLNYINSIIYVQTEDPEPEWMQQIVFLDDTELQETIVEQKEIIQGAEQIIKNNQEKLEENKRYKSILYTNGSELVEVVFDILEQLLDCDLSDFVDKKQEDFLIKKESYTLIGEIKGITSNVKNDNVSQLETHFQQYQDALEEEGRSENVFQVLIINPLRSKPIAEREPVHERQIKLATRNGSVIIETKTLLKLYECFLQHKITSEQCEKLFTHKTGLLQEQDILDLM